MPPLTILQKGILIVVVPLVFNLIWIGLFYTSIQNAATTIAKQNHLVSEIVSVSKCIASLNRILLDATKSIEPSAEQDRTSLIVADRDKLYSNFASLRALARDDRDIGAQVIALCQSIEGRIRESAAFSGAYKAKDFIVEVTRLSSTLAPGTVSDIQSLQAILAAREEEFARNMEMAEVERNRTRLIGFSGLAVNVTLACLLVILFQQNLTSRIRLLAQNSRALSDGGVEPERVPGGDELASLAQEFQTVRKDLLAASALRHSLIQVLAENIQSPLLECKPAIARLSKSADETGAPAAARKRALLALGTAVSASTRLVDDLMLLDNLESSSLPLSLQETDIKEIIDSAIELVSQTAAIRGVGIINEAGSHLIDADYSRMQQVISNLLTNAIKFSPPTSNVVVRGTSAGGNIRITVQDRGPGLEKSVRSKLFEKFYQTDAGKKAGGSGLGLAICKLIVTAHCGIIGVDSTPGEGAVFWFEIPVRQAKTWERT